MGVDWQGPLMPLTRSIDLLTLHDAGVAAAAGFSLLSPFSLARMPKARVFGKMFGKDEEIAKASFFNLVRALLYCVDVCITNASYIMS